MHRWELIGATFDAEAIGRRPCRGEDVVADAGLFPLIIRSTGGNRCSMAETRTRGKRGAARVEPWVLEPGSKRETGAPGKARLSNTRIARGQNHSQRTLHTPVFELMKGYNSIPAPRFQRRTAPVAFATAATTFCPAISISASVSVRSRGWNTTSMASDFFPSGSFSPS